MRKKLSKTKCMNKKHQRSNGYFKANQKNILRQNAIKVSV